MLCLVNLCFTCLGSSTNELIDASNLDYDEITYLDKLKVCTPQKLLETKPMRLCWRCVIQLRVTYKFREKILSSQETLQNCIQEINGDEDFSVSGIRQEHNQAEVEIIDHDYDAIVDTDGIKDETSLGTGSEQESDDDSSDVYFNKNEISDQNQKDDTTNSRRYVGNRPKKYKMGPKQEEGRFECIKCNFSFDKRWKLQEHNSRVHIHKEERDKNVHTCTYCKKAFKNSFLLGEHLTVHTGERNYICNICGVSLKRLVSLHRHLRSHAAPLGQKAKRTPYLCTICGKSFSFSNNVSRHMMIHQGIKKHECKICNRRFRVTTHLQVHMRTHTGEKPYVCNVCGNAFSLAASLRKHMTRHRKE